MDMICCAVRACPFWREGGLCKRNITVINESGGCDWIYSRNGNTRPNWQEGVTAYD